MSGLELFIILAGLLIGSGIDAASVRYGTDTSWVTGRSRCMACGKPVAWIDMIPLLGWLVLRGRCRACDTPIGLASPITEIAGMLVGLTAVILTPGDAGLLILTAALGWLLLALAAIDFRTFLLPDGLNAAVLLLGAVMVALYRAGEWPWHVAGAVAGYGVLWLVETLYRRVRGMDGLGRGDAKLLGAVGMWVGIEGLAPVLLIASLTAILAVLVQSALRRESVSGKSLIAFGPWIALGGYCVWLLTLGLSS